MPQAPMAWRVVSGAKICGRQKSFSIFRNHTEKPGLRSSACLRVLSYDHQLKHPQGPSWTPPGASEQGPGAEGGGGTGPAWPQR